MMQYEEDIAATGTALLRRFVRQERQAAFSQLVARHSRLVYSTCLRDTQNPAVAEDAAQALFLLLARKAPMLGGEGSLAAHQETRARLREQRLGKHMAVEGTTQTTGNDLWDQLEPVLHAALDALGCQARQKTIKVKANSITRPGRTLMPARASSDKCQKVGVIWIKSKTSAGGKARV